MQRGGTKLQLLGACVTFGGMFFGIVAWVLEVQDVPALLPSEMINHTNEK
jgi:hypothetical protein